MKSIKVIVSRFGSDGKEQVLYKNTVEVPDSLDFPFARVDLVLRLLYPHAEIISFKIY